VHRRSWEAKSGLDGAIAPWRAPEDESAICVLCAQDTQRLVEPSCEVTDELNHAGNGCAGVDKGKPVVVPAAAMGKDGAVIAAAEKTPGSDRVVFAPGAGKQLVRLALRQLVWVWLWGCLLFGQRSWKPAGERLGKIERSFEAA
jgi:hypothetical protein